MLFVDLLQVYSKKSFFIGEATPVNGRKLFSSSDLVSRIHSFIQRNRGKTNELSLAYSIKVSIQMRNLFFFKQILQSKLR